MKAINRIMPKINQRKGGDCRSVMEGKSADDKSQFKNINPNNNHHHFF
jgi:hypothetical protein